MMPAELYGLKVKDWNPNNKTITVRRTGMYQDGRTKTDWSLRTIPVPDVAVDILDARCSNMAAEAYIFPSTKGKTLSPSNCRKKLKKWLAEIGITKDIHPHSLRGSSGTYMMDHGVDVNTVSSIMGYADLSTTVKFYSTYTEAKSVYDRKKLNHVFSASDVVSQ